MFICISSMYSVTLKLSQSIVDTSNGSAMMCTSQAYSENKMSTERMVFYPPASLKRLIESEAKRKGVKASSFINMRMSEHLEYDPELDAKLTGGEGDE